MSLKTVGIIVAVVGLLVGLAFVLADVIGIGQHPGGFGIRQLIGTVVGVVIVVVGVVIYLRANRSSTPQ